MNNLVCRLILLVLCVAMTGLAEARSQRCKASKQATTPTSDFVINADGTAVHKKTGLMWKRCIEGTKGSACGGKPKKFYWEDMSKELRGVKFAAHRDWRVPTVDEMKTIVEKRCKRPSLNLDVFPNTSSLPNWTSSEDAGGKAWQMYITSGVAIKSSKAADAAVRLVRSP